MATKGLAKPAPPTNVATVPPTVVPAPEDGKVADGSVTGRDWVAAVEVALGVPTDKELTAILGRLSVRALARLAGALPAARTQAEARECAARSTPAAEPAPTYPVRPGVSNAHRVPQSRRAHEEVSTNPEIGTIDATWDVPTLGAITSDGKTVLIDRNLPQFLQVDGKRVNVHYLIAIHERAEQLGLWTGETYDDAHYAATVVENAAAKALGVSPVHYNEALEKYLTLAWQKPLQRLHPLTDLDQLQDWPAKQAEVKRKLKLS